MPIRIGTRSVTLASPPPRTFRRSTVSRCFLTGGDRLFSACYCRSDQAAATPITPLLFSPFYQGTHAARAQALDHCRSTIGVHVAPRMWRF
jgi:hypothetical protein